MSLIRGINKIHFSKNVPSCSHTSYLCAFFVLSIFLSASLQLTFSYVSWSYTYPDVTADWTCGQSGFTPACKLSHWATWKKPLTWQGGFVSEMIRGLFWASKVTRTSRKAKGIVGVRLSTWLELLWGVWIKEVGGYRSNTFFNEWVWSCSCLDCNSKNDLVGEHFSNWMIFLKLFWVHHRELINYSNMHREPLKKKKEVGKRERRQFEVLSIFFSFGCSRRVAWGFQWNLMFNFKTKPVKNIFCSWRPAFVVGC